MSPRGDLLASGGADSRVELHLLRALDEMHAIGSEQHNEAQPGGGAERSDADSFGDGGGNISRNVHERGLSVTCGGRLVAVLLKHKDGCGVRLVVHLLGPVPGQVNSRDMRIWHKDFDDEDAVFGSVLGPPTTGVVPVSMPVLLLIPRYPYTSAAVALGSSNTHYG